MELRTAFASTLRDIRNQRGLTQEDFSTISSRTNLSLLEREKTIPTLDKLDQLCSVLGIHPLTIMAICYSRKEGICIDHLMSLVDEELRALEGLTTDYS